MKMVDDGKDELDRMLDDLGRDTPVPSTDLMARVLQDAYDAQPVSSDVPLLPQQGAGLGQAIRSLFGGWTGIGGLALAACAGVMIGVFPPDALDSTLDLVLGAEFSEDYDDSETAYSFGWVQEDG